MSVRRRLQARIGAGNFTCLSFGGVTGAWPSLRRDLVATVIDGVESWGGYRSRQAAQEGERIEIDGEIVNDSRQFAV